jgi:geranylgeranyl reductase family protein
MAPSSGIRVEPDYDLIVVGGGPVGAEVGRRVARKGFKVAIFEEHSEIGRPVQCGGLVSEKVLKMTGYNKPLNFLRGADIYSPGGNKVSFMAEEPRAFVLDRENFDKHMIDKARKAGCDVHISTKVLGSAVVGDHVQVNAVKDEMEKWIFHSRLLVGADGVQGGVSRWFKLARPKEVISGYEIFYDGLNIDVDKAIVVSGRRYAPGFFGWIIPLGGSRALVGLGVSDADKPAVKYFEDMVASSPMKEMLKSGTRWERLAGCIPIGIVGRTYWDKVMVVGDAAAQVKPLSGGGLYTGLISAKHCGRVAVKALETGDCSRKVLKEYQDLWEHSIGKELKNMAMLRKLYLNLSDKQIDDLVEIINSKDLLPLITRFGDIDSPSILTKVMLKRAPSLLKFTGPLLRSLF